MSERLPLQFVLITPARNEAKYIGQTIDAVVAQTRRPARWVIVSDGSSDGTDEIIRAATAAHDWIDYLRMPDHRDRTFAAKANCFNAGMQRLQGQAFEIIGNLDADITFAPDYFAFLLGRFEATPALGVAGTPFVENTDRPHEHTYAHDTANLAHVSGACQLFRRECFESIGGYVPIEGGAIDWIAVTTARMKGWQTRTFTELICHHHRQIGTAGGGPLRARFHYGRKAYYVGGHPLWELPRGLFQMRRAPLILGGVAFIAGYAWAALTRVHRPVSAELMAFHRREQLARLRELLRIENGISHESHP